MKKLIIVSFFKYVKKNDKSGGNPGVWYQYLALSVPAGSSEYKWVTGSWSDCSRTCAVGKVNEFLVACSQ